MAAAEAVIDARSAQSPTQEQAPSALIETVDSLPILPLAASSLAVNRTHRVVRERALKLRSRKARLRSLFVPLGISAAFVIILCTAIWPLLVQYEASTSNIPDSSSQFFVMLIWFLPVCAAILVLVYMSRGRGSREITR